MTQLQLADKLGVTELIYRNKDGLFSINVVKGIDDREKSYDNVEEWRQLEKVAGMLFG